MLWAQRPESGREKWDVEGGGTGNYRGVRGLLKCTFVWGSDWKIFYHIEKSQVIVSDEFLQNDYVFSFT